MINEKVKAIWCDHCNAEIKEAAVRACIRKTCESKDKLPGVRKVFK